MNERKTTGIYLHYVDPKYHWLKAIWFSATQVGVISVGVACNSTAMQWSGFLLLAAVLIIKSRENKPLSITEARSKLNEIEAGQ